LEVYEKRWSEEENRMNELGLLFEISDEQVLKDMENVVRTVYI
jgi:hypothetical protein